MEQYFPAPGPTKAEFNQLSSDVTTMNNKITQVETFSITPSTGFTILESKCYKQCNAVFINALIEGTFTSSSTFATIPQGYRPSASMYAFAVDYNNDSFVPVYAYNNGGIRSFAPSSKLRINTMYMVE